METYRGKLLRPLLLCKEKQKQVPQCQAGLERGIKPQTAWPEEFTEDIIHAAARLDGNVSSPKSLMK